MVHKGFDEWGCHHSFVTGVADAELFDPGLDLRLVPLQRAIQATDLASGRVDQDRCRQAHDPERVGGLAARIEVAVKVLEREFAIETVDGQLAGAVDGHRDDREPLAPERRLQAVERRHLGATWTTPRRPKVE